LTFCVENWQTGYFCSGKHSHQFCLLTHFFFKLEARVQQIDRGARLMVWRVR